MRISDWSSDVCSSDLVQKVPANQPINPRIGRRYQANFLREGLASLSVVLRYQGNPQLVDVILVKAFVVIRPGADRGQRVSADLGCKRCRKDIILIGYPVRRAAADDAVVGVVVGAGIGTKEWSESRVDE